jgi:hypothetical protein
MVTTSEVSSVLFFFLTVTPHVQVALALPQWSCSSSNANVAQALQHVQARLGRFTADLL